MLKLWQKTKTVRVVVLGLLIVFSATAPQGYLMLANTQILSDVPWSLVVLIPYMIFWVMFYQGKIVKNGSDFRKECYREIVPNTKKMKWGLIAGCSFAMAIFCLLFFLFQSFRIPITAIPLSGIPWYMALTYIFMITAVAGISEEVGFRGYIQVPLQKRYGKNAALIITSLFFLLAHLGHAEFNYILPVYFGFSMMLGVVAYYTQSLLPSIIVHFVFDFAVFNTFWLLGRDQVTRQISETGFTELHTFMIVAMAIGSVIGWLTLNKLKAVAGAKYLN